MYQDGYYHMVFTHAEKDTPVTVLLIRDRVIYPRTTKIAQMDVDFHVVMGYKFFPIAYEFSSVSFS